MRITPQSRQEIAASKPVRKGIYEFELFSASDANGEGAVMKSEVTPELPALEIELSECPRTKTCDCKRSRNYCWGKYQIAEGWDGKRHLVDVGNEQL